MSVGITECLDNGDSDNWGPTVAILIFYNSQSNLNV